MKPSREDELLEYTGKFKAKDIAVKMNLTLRQVNYLSIKYGISLKADATNKQLTLLKHIDNYIKLNNRSPSFLDLKYLIKTKFIGHISGQVKALEKHGLITRLAYMARDIKITDKGYLAIN